MICVFYNLPKKEYTIVVSNVTESKDYMLDQSVEDDPKVMEDDSKSTEIDAKPVEDDSNSNEFESKSTESHETDPKVIMEDSK